MEKRFVFTGFEKAELESFEIAEPTGNQVLVRTTKSMISPGTEGICFSRLFDPGTHYDAWVQYPFYPGYIMIGKVEKCGPEVTSLSPGDRVVHIEPHASAALVNADVCCKVPDQLPDETAIWSTFAKITAMGARAAAYPLNAKVAVIGAGPVGQFSARWARAAGADVVIIDTVDARLKMAARAGIGTLETTADKALKPLMDHFNGVQPDIVVDSTGIPAVFAHALALPRKFGKVVLIGDTGKPAEQHLTPDVINRGITIVGAHVLHDTPDWNTKIITEYFFRLCLDGRMNVDGLITHRFKADDPQKIYMFNKEHRREIMGVIVDWQKRNQ